MKNLEFIHSKTKEMLESFGQKDVNFYFTLFKDKNIGIRERKELRQKLIDQIKKHKKDFNEKSFLKVGKKPGNSFVSASVSHCNYLGAFLFTFDKSISHRL